MSHWIFFFFLRVGWKPIPSFLFIPYIHSHISSNSNFSYSHFSPNFYCFLQFSIAFFARFVLAPAFQRHFLLLQKLSSKYFILSFFPLILFFKFSTVFRWNLRVADDWSLFLLPLFTSFSFYFHVFRCCFKPSIPLLSKIGKNL